MYKALVVLGLLLAIASATPAQTTYTSTADFRCHQASNYPIQYFSQFDCRGTQYFDNGVTAQTYIPQFELWINSWVVVSMYCDPNNVCHSSSLTVTAFTLPSGGNPGTYAYTWSGYDLTGGFHTGTAAGTWVDGTTFSIHGTWYEPIIKAGSTVTVNQ